MRGPDHPARRTCLALLAVTPALARAALTPAALAAAADPEAPTAGLTATAAGRVRAVTDDGTLVLEDGRRVRLAALRLPQASDLPVGPATAAERQQIAALAGLAHDHLRTTVEGRSVRLWLESLARDRWGRWLAQVCPAPDGPWVQADLIDRGLARVATLPGAAAAAPLLLAREASARHARRGLWAGRLYAPREPEETWPWLGTFQIVRGAVQDTAKVRSRVYLNFGRDWRRDFTVRIDHPDRIGFSVPELLDLAQQTVQVRGWLFERDGPMIAPDHPAALETTVHLARG